MKTISVQEFKNLLETEPALAVLDVRTPAEYHRVHIPNARNEPLDLLEPKAWAARENIARDREIFLLCQSNPRARKAAEKFALLGLENTTVVEGGTEAWSAAGFPLIKGTSRVISLERQVRIAAGSLVLIGIILGAFVAPAFYGLSAFVGGGLVFAGITDFCGMGLLLAKLPWNKRMPNGCTD